MRRYGVVAGALALALTACTTAEPPDPGPRSEQSPTDSPGAGPDPGTQDRSPATRQPVVLVSHATSAGLALSRREAGRVLRRGLAGRPVLAAPGLPTGPGVPVAEGARSVVREVERRPELVGIVPATAVGPTVRPALVGGADPIRAPEDYPLTVPGPEPPEPTTLTVVGDVMLTRGVTDPANARRPLGPRLRSADLTVGNLESTLSTAGAAQQGGDSFGAGPELLGPLGRAGFDALSLANNHTGDFQDLALIETVRLLRRSAIIPFGAGKDLTEASRPAVVERNGVRFGFLGFNAIGETPMAGPGTPGALSVRMPPRTGPLQEADLRHVTRQVSRLDGRVDVVVVLPHWGTQYTHSPEPVQRTVARGLVDAGADLVVGGHPHWVQGLDLHDGVVIAHSLGNFVFDMDFMTETQQGVVLEAAYWGDELKSFDLVPYRMDRTFAPRPAGPDESAEILGDVWSTSTGPFSAR
jgi:hypothetical protein